MFQISKQDIKQGIGLLLLAVIIGLIGTGVLMSVILLGYNFYHIFVNESFNVEYITSYLIIGIYVCFSWFWIIDNLYTKLKG